jgi:hypothetical protein
MGDSLDTWRARIGLCGCSSGCSLSDDNILYRALININDGPLFIQLCLTLCVIRTLLTSANIEINPGPDFSLEDISDLINKSASSTKNTIITSLNDVNTNLTGHISALDGKISLLQNELGIANSKITHLEERVEMLENKNREKNVIIFNVPEKIID